MNKEQQYEHVALQIKGLIESETDLIANLSNIANLLGEAFSWWWTGFYLVKDKELILGPFRGPVACTRIAFGKGVCGTAWQEKKPIRVKNVNDFPGHIACSAESLSEIVVPILKDNEVQMVLDVDSEMENHFDELDEKYLERICYMIAEKL
ncbi:MAG: GAF domain-containing protein [Bacteroidota bacterium]